MKRALVLFAVLLVGLLSARSAHAGSIARVTYYNLTGYTATETWTTAGRTAACPDYYTRTHAHVLIVGTGETRDCEDTGDPSYFNYGMFKLDVYSPYGPPWWLTCGACDLEIEIYW